MNYLNDKKLIIRVIAGVLLLSSVAACARTSVTPVANNQVIISTSAAPACGRTGAANVALKMAAIETIRRGFTKFVILGANSANNVSAISTGPTYSNTSGRYTVYGNSVYGSSQTNYGSNNITFFGSNDADLNVLMLRQGDELFANGVDAKSTLGPDWEVQVSEGVNTCT